MSRAADEMRDAFARQAAKACKDLLDEVHTVVDGAPRDVDVGLTVLGLHMDTGILRLRLRLRLTAGLVSVHSAFWLDVGIRRGNMVVDLWTRVSELLVELVRRFPTTPKPDALQEKQS